MDNNKKSSQNYSRAGNSKAFLPTDSSRRTTDLQSNKPWPQNSRRREQPTGIRNDTKQYPSVKQRPNVDKRPRPRGGGNAPDYVNDDAAACASNDISLARPDLAQGAVRKNAHKYELNSVYAPGSKKQNLNHLVNFHYTPRESEYSNGYSVFGRGSGGSRHNAGASSSKKHRYKKEQFIQANFQFVIASSAKLKITSSPDVLINWDLIEQINIQTTEEPQCPICLYPPVAAKVTRCGHAFCWPCILHYHSLSDKAWCKCPICYEVIHTEDLKSTTIVQQRQYQIGEEITFQLMRRKKGSIMIEKFKSNSPCVEHYPQVSKDDERKLFSKFLIAKRADILEIIERERRDLVADEDVTSPEFFFVQKALDAAAERSKKLSELYAAEESESEADEIKGTQDKSEPQTVMLEKDHNTEDQSVKEVADALEETAADGVAAADVAKYYYFYQCVDGQNVFLHPLNVKMLQACYGTLDHAPLIISSKILQKEYYSMDEDYRRKFTCLGHLPLTCQFTAVEIVLQPPIVTTAILNLFQNNLLDRKMERQRRKREECKREKKINEIHERQMGKLISRTANLNLTSSEEFPKCGFTESLVSPGPKASDGASTSAAVAAPKGGVSYSAVATLNSPEFSDWGKATWASKSPKIGETERSCEREPDNGVPLCTNLSDVVAEAISKNKNAAGKGGAKGGRKKRNKAIPLIVTGMNYGAN